MSTRERALPLLLLPGLLCDEEVWAAQAEALRHARDVIVGPLGLDDSVDRLDAMARHLLDAVAAPRFALAGHSMGGRIALEMLRLAPGRVGGLALLDSGTAPRPDGTAGDAEVRSRHALVALARSQGMEAAAREWLPTMVHPAVIGSTLFERLVAMVTRSHPARFAAQVQALLHRADAEPVLRGVGCPVLLVCGEQDRWSPPERHRAMQALLPGTVLQLIGECGHMSPMERPEAVSAALAQWLEVCDEDA
jgi:pimeloyl-ACP methyl ester carboxylesterase